MKECMRCQFCGKDCYEGSSYSCELFGEDIPEWANNGDGCLLKAQEVKKILKITGSLLLVGTGEMGKFGYPEFTKEDKAHNEKVIKEHNAYIEELKKRCKNRGKS